MEQASDPSYSFLSSVTEASVASSSYSSPVSLPYSPATSSHQWRYDVFVSFCGKDTRTKFKAHLYNVLEHVGIDHFDDEDGSERGMVVSEMLREAIQHSRVALVVLSRNYAGSRWCLDELIEILECNNKFRRQHAVHPIFYEIDPADVRKQEGQFGEIFTGCALEHPDKAEAWKHALTTIGNLSGWHLTNDKDESEFIDKIVKQLSDQHFYERTSYFVEYPVVHDNIEKVITSLKMTSQAVRIIGLYGKKGMGKTTMAKIICRRLSDAFTYVKVFETIRNENIREIMNRRRHDILLVLDNVDEMMASYVKILLGECKRLRLGSRIIIISREEKILRDLGVYERYMVSGFGAEESIRLFKHHAFPGGGNGTPRGFEKVCKHLLHYSGGNPLWIKIMGDVLSQKPQLEQWNEILENLVITPYLDSAGILTESSYPSYLLKVGPFGGLHGGVPFDDNTYTGIRRISICVSWKVETLTVDYDFRGCLVRVRHGKTEHSNSKTYTVELDFPDEYLVSMSGSIKSLVQSLKFRSNKNEYGPFGETDGNDYSFSTTESEPEQTREKMIVGFLGRAGSYIDSIGANFGPVEHPYYFKEMGPFGGQGGQEWNHRRHTDVRQLKVGILNSVITSITVLYDDNGRPVGPFKVGDTNEGLIHMITLDFPYEYLTSISGYIVEDSEKAIIQSLNFRSNIKIYKFGKEPEDNGVETMGRRFSCPCSNGKIVGFFGRSTPGHLESIGVYLEPVSHIYPLKNLGPIGGDQGHDWDDEVHEHIMKITIWSGLVIDSIMFVYDNDGVHAESVRHGGPGGEETDVIELYHPTEQITAVSGYFGDLDGVTVIGSLTFHSTRRTYGPYGHFVGGTFFTFPPTIGKIVGFFGKSDIYLNSIGVHMKLYSGKDYPFKSVGLLGCTGGDVWDDGEHNDVCQIDVVVREDEEVIQSVQFGYKSNGSSEQSCVHGSNTLGRRYRVKLAYPREYLTSVSGYFENDSPSGIRSLSFYSSERVLGPFGDEKGKYFSFPVTGGKIIGFYGKCSASNLISIGAYFQPMIDLYPLKVVGPFGGSGGKPFEDRGFTGVRQIHISSGRIINHMFFEYDRKGHEVTSDGYETSHGQPKHKTIKLDYPTEFLTSIFGYIRTNENPVIVGSLTFQSNVRRYGPYGDEEGQFFWFPSTGGKITGFHGRSGAMLDSVGVYMEPIYHTSPPKSISVGGNGGIPWDDGCYTDVRQIKILIGSVIESILIEYDSNGMPIQCPQHGETSGWESNTEENSKGWNITSLSKVSRWFYGRQQGPKWHTVKLDFPREYLVSLSGYIGKEVTGEEVVQSLTVTSNRRIYGPFGTPKGSHFKLPEGDDGRIIGIYGRSESYLHAIGVHLEPYLHAIRDRRV